ncbi:MAG TPA: M66 family metalloprotease [Polyangia bacterium]|jgi:hypothetical protein|nr:M66 family metalloprotease [Polyangia bacterium]
MAASLAGALVGCNGDIGDGQHPAANPADGGTGAPPVGAPGEIAGEGGSGGTMNTGGTGAGGNVEPTGTGGKATADAGAGGNGAGGMGGPAASDLVHGLAISDVAIYQAVKVSLVNMGQAVTMTGTPLVRNRQALIRVFVTPAANWTPRPVVARLQWGTGAGASRDAMASIAGASADATIGTTFNFNLSAADLVTPQVQWSLSLLEAPGGTGAGDTTGARIPADGTQVSLPTTDPGAALRIAFIPIRNANTLPDTSDAQIKFFTDAMMATYPVAKIEATVRDPIDFTSTIAAQGTGWDAALNQVCMTRQTDNPDRNVFYFGLVTPGAFQTYCARGCVEGIAVLATNPNQDFMRCSMGVGYTNMGSGVFLQEVAHSMGRSHAPCGNPAQPDKNYPYAGGKIGVWGYDNIHQKLIDPTRTVDFMSYCSPTWISDYTFAHLLPWIQSVNLLGPQMDVTSSATTPELASGAFPSETAAGALPIVAPSTLHYPAARWRVATVEWDGGVLWGPVMGFGALADGIAHAVVLRDAAGKQVTVNGVLFPHSNTGGGMLLLPESAPAQVSALQFGGSGFRSVRAQ